MEPDTFAILVAAVLLLGDLTGCSPRPSPLPTVRPGPVQTVPAPGLDDPAPKADPYEWI